MDNYCSVCGTKLIKKELEEEGFIPYCKACNSFVFPKYSVAVSMIVVYQKKEILLIQQYGKKDNILVAGYVNLGEALEDAVRRELMEETGLTPDRIQYNRSKYYEKSNTLMCNFTVHISSKDSIKPNKEIDAYHFYGKEEALDYIKSNSLAKEFLAKYLEDIKNE